MMCNPRNEVGTRLRKNMPCHLNKHNSMHTYCDNTCTVSKLASPRACRQPRPSDVSLLSRLRFCLSQFRLSHFRLTRFRVSRFRLMRFRVSTAAAKT